MDAVLVLLAIVYLPIHGLFWLGIRSERKRMERLYAVAIQHTITIAQRGRRGTR